MESNRVTNFYVREDDFTSSEKNGFINFIDTVALLLEYRYGQYDEKTGELLMPVILTMHNPDGTNSKDKDLPHIVYNLNNLKPGLVGKDTRDIKHRAKATYRKFSELLQEEVDMIKYSQTIDAELEFRFFGSNEDIYKWTTRIRNLINTDIAFFEDAGIFKILWLGESDESSSFNGKYYSSRSLKYFFQYEDIIEKEVYPLQGLNLRLRAILNKRQFRRIDSPTLISEQEIK